jgi:hypothetical protein
LRHFAWMSCHDSQPRIDCAKSDSISGSDGFMRDFYRVAGLQSNPKVAFGIQ